MWDRLDKKARDAILFVVGTFGVINELFVVPEPRPSILIFLGSLIGVPIVFAADERRKKSDDEQP